MCVGVGACVRMCVCHALPCGHDSDYSVCLTTFKLHMLVMNDERRNRDNFG